MVCLLSVDASQPEMIETILRIEVGCAFAGVDAAVPLINHEIGAAEQVERLGVGDRTIDFLFEKLNGFVDLAGCEKFLRRNGRARWLEQDCGKESGKQQPR